MQPHTAAVITAFIYFLDPANSEAKYVDLVVEYARNRKDYRIEKTAQYSNLMKLKVAGLWSCTVTIQYQGHHAYTRHDNEPQIQEEFDFYPHVISNGQTKNSNFYKGFKGDIRHQAKRISFVGEYQGKVTNYEVYIR